MIMSARSAPSGLFCDVLKWFGFLKKDNSCVEAITKRADCEKKIHRPPISDSIVIPTTIVPLWHVSCHPPCTDCTVDGNWSSHEWTISYWLFTMRGGLQLSNASLRSVGMRWKGVIVKKSILSLEVFKNYAHRMHANTNIGLTSFKSNRTGFWTCGKHESWTPRLERKMRRTRGRRV